jgi:hypothetical protein
MCVVLFVTTSFHKHIVPIRCAVCIQDARRDACLFNVCCPCIIVYQYNETNMMHTLFNLINKIKGLYMPRALVFHLQEVLHQRHARDIPSVVGAAYPENEQVMLKTCRGS